jgi:hypothetical protein
MPCLTNFLSYMYLHNMLGRNNYILVLNMSYFAKKKNISYATSVIIHHNFFTRILFFMHI